jgi:hypothetical protein
MHESAEDLGRHVRFLNDSITSGRNSDHLIRRPPVARLLIVVILWTRILGCNRYKPSVEPSPLQLRQENIGRQTTRVHENHHGQHYKERRTRPCLTAQSCRSRKNIYRDDYQD